MALTGQTKPITHLYNILIHIHSANSVEIESIVCQPMTLRLVELDEIGLGQLNDLFRRQNWRNVNLIENASC